MSEKHCYYGLRSKMLQQIGKIPTFAFSFMKKLYLYITKSFIGTFIFTFFIVLFIWVMQFVWLYVDEMVGKGLEVKILAELLFHTAVTAVPFSLPLAVLLASLMCFGNFGEHYELVAMKASGISMWKIMRPLIYFSLFLCIMAFFFSNSVLPVAMLKSKTLLFDVRKQKLAFDIKEGTFYRDLDNYVLYVNKKGEDGTHIYGVKIYDHTECLGCTRVMTADSGKMELSPNQRCLVFTLYNGYSYTDVTSENYKVNRPFERMSFKEEQIKFSMKEFDMTRTDESAYKSYQQMMNIHQLSHSLDSLQNRQVEKQDLFTDGFINRWSNYSNRNQNIQLAEPNRNMVKEIDSLADTIRVLKWPLLGSYSDDERASILEMAIGSARNAKDNVSFNKSDFKSNDENIKQHKKEWHKKFTLSIACLIFFFIGAPLGTIIRKGGLGLPVVISVLFFVVYYVVSTVGERMAVFGNMNMFLGIWLSSIVLFPIGLFLTFKATTDAALFDGDSWKKAFKKIFHRKSIES